MKRNTSLVALAAVMLVIVAAFAPAPAVAQDAPTHSMDDALLLMIASQSRLYDDYSPSISMRVPGHAVVVASVPPQGASRAEINEQKALADTYRQLAGSLTAVPEVQQHLENRANQHSEQAQDLARARRRFQRNRHNILRQAERTIARPVAKIGSALFRGGKAVFRGIGRVGRVVVTIAKDEVIFRARNIVRAKIQDLVDIGRGRLDAVLNRIASRWGLPAAELLREFVVNPAFNRLQAQIQRHVDRLVGEEGSGEDGISTGGTEPEEEDDYNPDFSNVDEEGDTDYDDNGAEPASDTEEPDVPDVAFDENQVFDVYEWFAASSCNRFAGQIPSWYEDTEKHAGPWLEMQWLSCHWNSDLRESGYGCDADGNFCPTLPGRVEVEIYAYPTVSDAQEGFRGYAANCTTDFTCEGSATELLWQEEGPETAYAGGISYSTRLISLNDNVVIELWWGGSESASDIYGLLSTANALIDPLQH